MKNECIYNKGVKRKYKQNFTGTDRVCTDDECANCGWNPEVSEKRIEKIRSEIINGTFGKKA